MTRCPVGQFTPVFRATGDIAPWRAVSMDGDNQVAPAITNQFDVPGVTFGDSKAFNSNLHAESGDLVRLQFGDIKKIEVLEYPELGMEAVWRIEVENFPAFIIVDDKGENFFASLTEAPPPNGEVLSL